MKQRPPATDLRGPKASAESLTARRINLAEDDAVDSQSGLFSSAASLPPTFSFSMLGPPPSSSRPPPVETRDSGCEIELGEPTLSSRSPSPASSALRMFLPSRCSIFFLNRENPPRSSSMLVSSQCRISVDDGCDKRWLASWLRFVPTPAFSPRSPSCPPPVATHTLTRPVSRGNTFLNEHLTVDRSVSSFFGSSAWVRLDFFSDEYFLGWTHRVSARSEDSLWGVRLDNVAVWLRIHYRVEGGMGGRWRNAWEKCGLGIPGIPSLFLTSNELIFDLRRVHRSR